MRTLSSLLLLGSLALTAQAQGNYQIPNSDFENWSSDSELATSWHSFSTAAGSLNNYKDMSPAPSKVSGYKGSAVQIYSKWVGVFIWGANANGNLTTGLINMGSQTPSDASNYNFSDIDNASGCLAFAGRPDSVVFYAKFTSGGSDNGRVQLILHDGVEYRDPEISDQAGNRVGKASVLIPKSEDWTRHSGAFTYDKETPATQYLLASMTTNPVPGGSVNDYLTVDELQLIYNHSLSTLSYNGSQVSGFDKATLSYDLSAETYDPALLSCTADGAGATVETSFDEATCLLTVTVKGNDYEANPGSLTTYTIQFKQPVREAVTTTYRSQLTANSTTAADAPVDAVAELTTESDGSTTFCLKNVVLTTGMGLGNLRLPNVTVEGDRYTYSGTFTFEDGDEAYPYGWMGSMYGAMPATLEATLSGSTLTAEVVFTLPGVDYTYRLVFAEAVTVDETTEILSSGTPKNYTFTRSLPAGYSTVCLPVNAQLSGTAYEMTGAADGVVHFTKVAATGSRTTLSPNVPYLVYSQSATTLTRHYGGTLEADPEAVTFGSYTLRGNYVPAFPATGAYALHIDGDVISFLPAAAGAAIGSTEAYLTAEGTADAEVHIGIDGVISAITTATAAGSVSAPVYNLKGIRVAEGAQGLPAGVYLMNGRKLIVR